MADPKELTDRIAKEENEADKAAFSKYTTEPIKRGLNAIKDTIIGTPEQNKKAADERRARNAANPDTANAKLDKAVGMGGYKKGGKVKTKKYEMGGLTFSDMSDEDRGAAASAAIKDLDARQAAKSAEAGGMGGMGKGPRMAPPKMGGSIRENLNDLESQGVDTGFDATEAKRNMARAGTRHAVGKMNLSDRGYGASETKRNLNRAVSGMKSGGSVSSASRRADGIATKGKTKGRIV